MAIKIDFEKAYNHVRWSFIKDNLIKMQLPRPLVDVIWGCITTSSMSVLWNGIPTEAFNPTRGIHQGDPLSPYLFVICMERLTHMIEAAVLEKRWKPVTANRGGPPISNLMFVDDLVLFAEASVDQVQVVKKCLDKICDASG